MQITSLKATGIDLTPAIKEYVELKLDYIAKLVSKEESASIDVEVGKSTYHHNKGEIMFARFTLSIPGEMFTVEETEEELYKAIDKAKDDLSRRIIDRKERLTDRNRQPRPDKM